MAQVDPRYFNWGERFQEGMETSRQRRLQDIALGQQQEDRAMRLEDRQRAIAGEQEQKAIGVEELRRKKLLNMSSGLVRAFEIKQKTGNSAPLDGFWTAIRPELAKDFGQDPGEWNDENIKIAYQILAQSGGTVDAPQQKEVPQITPYQQAQLDLERQKLGAKNDAATAKADSAVTDKIKTATGIARAKQGYAAIDAARSSLATLDELEASLAEGAEFGPVAGRLPSFSGATQRGETAFAKLGLANIKSLPGPASDKDIQFIKSANLNEKMDQATLAKLIPKVREAAQRIIEKNMQVNALIEEGVSPSEAELQVWGASQGPGPGIAAPKRLKYNPATGALE